MLRQLLLLVCAALISSSCTSPSDPPAEEALVRAEGVVELPAGFTLAAADLKVLDVYGEGEITLGADGAFTAMVPTNGLLPVDLVDGNGRVVLLGYLGADGGEISARQTAMVLAFYALGGFTLPVENHAALMELLAEEPAVQTLAGVVEARVVTNPAALADGDDELIAAIRAARDAMLADAEAKFGPPRFRPSSEAAGLRIIADAGTLLTVEPSAAQSGIELLQNPSGAGILAQNSFRRYATYLAYQTATEDEDGVKTTLTSPELIGEAHDISSTSRLEFFSAIGDVFTGHSPFEPVRTALVELPLSRGSAKTYYDVVVLGPAIELTYPPIFEDTRYFPVIETWNTQLDRLRFKMFWLDFAWPALETFLFVRGAGAQEQKLDDFVAEFKSLCDQRLAGLGIALRSKDPREGGLVVAMNLLLNALREDTFRLEFVNGCKRALAQSALNQANFEAMSQKLAGRAAAATILAAIQIALEVGDISAVIHDLGVSRTGEVWNVTVVAPPVRLDPSSVTVTLNQPAATLTASVKNAPSGSFVFRWSTPGAYGVLSDGSQQGKSFDSTVSTVTYLANVGAIKNGNLDTVTVAVYEDDSGAIGADSTYLGQASSQIKGVRDDDGGPVSIEAYPHNQPRPEDVCLLNAVLDAESVPAGAYSLRWTTSGDFGYLENNQTEVEGVDLWDVAYYAQPEVEDGMTDSVTVEITRIADGAPMGDAEILIDIWNPQTVYGLCGDPAGQLPPYLGSGTSWTFYLVEHGPWMGADFYARPGDEVHANLACVGGSCSADVGPVYLRRGAAGEPPDTSVLIVSEGHYSCTSQEEGIGCTMIDITVTVP